MGHAYNTLNDFDDSDYELDDELLDVELDFDDDIDSYLNRQEAFVDVLEVKSGRRLNKKSKTENKSIANRLPQDWQDFDYGEDDDFIDY